MLQVSSWVAGEVAKSKDPKIAGNTIGLFINLADKLFAMNSFNTLMEILSGLNNANIARLRPAWAVRIFGFDLLSLLCPAALNARSSGGVRQGYGDL